MPTTKPGPLAGFAPDLLAGRLALVTGAARGIGLATAAALAAAGARVVLADLDEASAAEAASSIACPAGAAVGIGLDVTDAEACMTALGRLEERHGPVGILVNNAGLFRRSALGAGDDLATWRQVQAVNADGPFHMVRAALGQLRATRGAVVNIASVRGLTAAEQAAAYSASKGLLVMLTRSLAVELAPAGVRANAVAPSEVATAMTEGIYQDPAMRERVLARIPLGRPAGPEEIAAAVVFLASPLAAFVTGAVLAVDGGFLAT